ncbi:DUF1820 family protein [Coxiella burnetii]|uniref:Hypothetical cytosolic protein n=2 Tax=Coxiella burnetii TaxID=777 RepID=Q83CN3_COXBU|nr:DUF1820 family protein [Coxiella burnetii]NP_820077.1 hypothetical protein CBU_1078 [Coxiella burnetii RSA 493]AAO90591.1 hypothetical cytosolic protein [Coxiella burnetii RSA 493]ABS76629.1 hypothetical cytosolic protein [Coxiella burnetii Dugway 5J108-111]ABX78541.1 conserved hypothetical protein [Coxiella burnetii RSA 331]ACJ18299.1 hypothetical cytosolic protein [Coxiella burnetii CbuG_Q212]ACJ20164.1 hypothetical cytosolic protein [Coxiella burnetii CbuK_Q154]
MHEKQRIYRIIFSQDEKIYEIYARYISEENLMGFIELEDLLFSEGNSVVVDPSEEKLKTEFQGVKRSYIPMHMILRIDEMEKEGAAKIKGLTPKGNVHHLPSAFNKPAKDKE